MASEHNETFLESITGSHLRLRNITSTEPFRNISLEERIAEFVHTKFHFYGYFTVSGCGIFTNLLVIAAVLYSNKIQKTSAGLLIIVLAIVDFFVCAFGTIGFAIYYNEHINSMPYCLIIRYLWSVTRFYSHWIMVLISGNRYAMVCHPFTHKKVTSLKSTLCQLAVLLLFCTVGALYIFFIYDNEKNYCLFEADNLWIYYISTVVIYFVFSGFVPVTVTIALTIHVFQTFKNNNVACLSRQGASTDPRKKLEEQVTKALVASNVVFVLLSFPLYIVYVPYFFSTYHKPFSVPVANNLSTSVFILNVVESANYAVNLFLYSWYSPMFRQSVVCLFTNRCG